MSSQGKKLSMRVVETVAKALGEDPTEMPPIEQTISAEALDQLFHKGTQLSGAFTVFPYSGVWVLAHGDGTVDVFDEFKATTTDEELPDEVLEPSTNERLLILNVNGERHAFHGDELDAIHTIVDKADDSTEAWEETIKYAQEQ